MKILWAFFLFSALIHCALPCEILVMAKNNAHPDAQEDRRGSWKRGYPVVVKPDGHVWGNQEGLPTFVILKLPGISGGKVIQYLSEQMTNTVSGGTTNEQTFRRRLWRFRLDDMPLAARAKLATNGSLTIGPKGDYTWSQVKGFLRNQQTGLDETKDL